MPSNIARTKFVEQAAMEFWNGPFTLNALPSYGVMCEVAHPELITEVEVEGMIKRQAVNAVQFALAASVEWGLDVTGVGLPIGTTAGAVVDFGFAAVQGAGALSSLEELFTGDYKRFGSALAGLKQKDPCSLMSDAHKLLSVAESVSKSSNVRLEEFLERLQGKIKKIVSRAGPAIGDSIAAFIPADAGLSGAVIAEMIAALDENPYDAVCKLWKKLPDVAQRLLRNPSQLIRFMNEIIDVTVSFLKGAESQQSSSRFQSFMAAADKVTSFISAVPGGFKLSGSFQKIANKLADYLENTVKPAIPQFAKMISSIITMVFSLLAVYQLIASGEYETILDIDRKDIVEDPGSVETQITPDNQHGKTPTQESRVHRILILSELLRDVNS